MEDTITRLLDKSTEAFIMGIEIYNKPTIKYRTEGFSFFICNAWELMLKAKLIKDFGEQSIYFADKPNRTISLENTLGKVFTNNKDPMRINLEKIIDLRNTSTHFITEDYESIYAPLFQACVVNFFNKIQEFHNIDVTKFIENNFLSLNLKVEKLTDSEIRAKYTPEIAEKLILERNELSVEAENLNDKFSIAVKTNFYITKKREEADLIIGVDKNADASVQIVKEMRDPNNLYPFTTKAVIKQINRRLEKSNIKLARPNLQIKKNPSTKNIGFNTNDFQLFIKFYDIKQNDKFTYHIKVGNRFCYSQQLIDFIFNELKKDPEYIILNLKKALKKKITPGAKEF